MLFRQRICARNGCRPALPIGAMHYQIPRMGINISSVWSARRNVVVLIAWCGPVATPAAPARKGCSCSAGSAKSSSIS